MALQAMNLSSDSQNLDTPVPFTLSPLAIEDFDDTPVFNLTPAAHQELQAQTIMDALTAFDYRPGVLAEEFQAARQAYDALQGEMDHDAFVRLQDAFNKACRGLFFTLHTWMPKA